MKQKKFSTRMLSMLLAVVMVFSLVSPVVGHAEGARELLSVSGNVSITVPYGTTQEDVIARLPESVSAEVAKEFSVLENELSYDFEDAAQLEDWNVYSSLISIVDGKLHYPRNSNVKATVGPNTMTDYVVEADIQIVVTDQSRDAGVMFRVVNATGDGPDSYNGYYAGVGVLDFNEAVWRYGVKIGYATKADNNNGAWHDVSMHELSLDLTKAHTLKIVVVDNYYAVFVKEAGADDSTYIHVTTAQQDLFAAGSVGLRAYQQEFTGDNLKVRAVTQADLDAAGILLTDSLTVPVTGWTCEGYDGETAGQYHFHGTIADGEGYVNTAGYTATANVTVQAAPALVEQDHSVPFSQVNVEDEFWSTRQKQFICEVIPTAIARVSAGTGGIPNFEKAAAYLAGKEGENYTTTDGRGHSGAKYVDSDVYKLVEAMCYALQLDAKGDEEMLAGQAYISETLETWIPWFAGSQEADGYLYTCFTLDDSEIPASQPRFTGRRDADPIKTDGTPYDLVGTAEYDQLVDFDDHELYCVGHFYEAAVAHYRATGDYRLLDVAVKNADLVARTFGPDDATQVQAVPGHQEIELALIKLANVCNEIGGEYAAKADSYVEVARFFLDERGTDAESGYVWSHDGYNTSAGWLNGEYSQDKQTAADLREGYGHCVRAEYQYTGMADVALMEIAAGNENPYDEALRAVWDDIANKKQYITGGVGVSYGSESFGDAYNIPTNQSYCETCAQVANAMWAQRMGLLYDESLYADQIETNLYNSIISCVNFDGNAFFYGNPMQSDNGGLRSSWFGTACCPPNLLRTVASIGGYIYTQDADGAIGVDQYIGNSATLNVGGTIVNVKLETTMPWYGETTFTVLNDVTTSIRFRIPAWAVYGNTAKVNGEEIEVTDNGKGYLVIDREWKAGDKVELNFPMEPVKVRMAEEFESYEGTAAVRRGPIIFAAEAHDNPDVNLASAIVAADAEFEVGELVRLPGREGEDHYNVETILTLTTSTVSKGLFTDPEYSDLVMIPYYAWGNRGSTVMRVFLNEEEQTGTAGLEQYATPSAPYTWRTDSVGNINNGSYDGSSRWTAWSTPYINTKAEDRNLWVQYEFEGGSVTLNSMAIQWYDDGGGVKVPTGMSLEYWDGEAWVAVTGLTNASSFPKNQVQEYGFDTFTTNKLRVYPYNSGMTSTVATPGIVEWTLEGEAVMKTELKALIAEAAALVEADYTVGSWAELVAAVAEGQAVLDSVTADKAAVQAAVDALSAAIDALMPRGNVNQVEALINKIGQVTLESGDAIKAARDAYESLTDEEKALVTNLDTLLQAEHDYTILLAEDLVDRAEAAAEAAEKAYQDALKAAEEAEEQIAEDMEAAEKAREEAEAAKKAAEDAKALAEAAKTAAEEAKAAAEASAAEAAAEALKAAEEAVKAAEEAQKAAEYAAKAADALKQAQEAQAAAEAAQKAAEEAKAEAEKAKQEAEEAAERAKENSEAAKKAAEEAEKAAAAAELAAAKYDALFEIAVLARTVNTEELSEHQLAEYKQLIDDAMNGVTAAEDLDQVAAILEDVQAALEAILASCPANAFTDLDLSRWYHEGIDFALANGYMKGMGGSAFGPDVQADRGMIATILYRMAGEPSVEGLENVFDDVYANTYYYDAVIWAAAEGIVNGRGDGTFDPTGNVTRQELVVMLHRAAGLPETEATLDAYTDADTVDGYAQAAMAWAVENGIINGVTDTTLAPKDTTTRAMVATILMRYVQK